MPDPAANVTQIKEAALGLGFDAFGVALTEPLHNTPDGRHYREWIGAGKHGGMSYLSRGEEPRLDPGEVLPAVCAVVSVGMNYWYEDLHTPQGEAPTGVVARYARGRDYHKVFKSKLKLLEEAIQGILPGVKTRRYVDTGPVLEKLWAQRAGLGWRGKHTNLVSRKLGSWLFLGEILVDRELAPSDPHQDYCGVCTRCIDACPTRAITGPYQLDARLCISYLTIEHRGSIPVKLRRPMGAHIFGCDDCLEVCPWNRFAAVSREADFHPRPGTLAPLLLDLLKMNEEEFYRQFSGTPIVRAKRDGLVRNVCIALGNTGRDSTDIQARTAIAGALQEATGDFSEIVGEHASWALAEMQPSNSGATQS